MGDHVSVQTASIAIILVGFAAGAEIDIVGYLTARYFGMKSYGLIYGTIMMASTLFLAACGYAGGRLYDVYHGYREALMLFAGLYAVSAVSYLLLGPYPKREAASPENSVGTPVPAE
jgi:MFS family permease